MARVAVQRRVHVRAARQTQPRRAAQRGDALHRAEAHLQQRFPIESPLGFGVPVPNGKTTFIPTV